MFAGLRCARCPLCRLLIGNRFRGGIHVAVKFASSAKKNGFNCVSPLAGWGSHRANPVASATGQVDTFKMTTTKKRMPPSTSQIIPSC
jgi:hypothetical protein